MEIFDFASACFTKSADGKWTLDRDWTVHPPSQIETEVLFAHCLQLDRLLVPVVNYFFAGVIHTAEELDNAKFEEVIRWLGAVRSVVGPPNPFLVDKIYAASLGPAE